MLKKPVDTIVEEAAKAVDRVLNNNITVETCAEKKNKDKWEREKIVSKLVVKLGGVGPGEVK